MSLEGQATPGPLVCLHQAHEAEAVDRVRRPATNSERSILAGTLAAASAEGFSARQQGQYAAALAGRCLAAVALPYAISLAR